jgi:hypothetical protein
MAVLDLIKNKPLKTLRPRAVRLVAELHERGNTLFSHADVEEITFHPLFGMPDVSTTRPHSRISSQ